LVAVRKIVAVPDTCPVAALKFKPVGSAGLIANVSVPNPPVAVIGIKGVSARF
jgi:hypothetical protein